MKLILSARNALAAYLASSADFSIDEHDWRTAQRQRLIEPLHHFSRARLVATDEHTVGVREILDRRSLAQKFGI